MEPSCQRRGSRGPRSSVRTTSPDSGQIARVTSALVLADIDLGAVYALADVHSIKLAHCAAAPAAR